MDWIVINKESAKSLKNKKIYCFGASGRYINELVNLGLHEQIEAVIELNPKLTGTVSVGGLEYPFCSPNVIDSLDVLSTSIVVTSSFTADIEEVLRQKNITDEVYRVLTEEDRIELQYKERYSQDALEDIIIFRSGPMEYVPGADFFDNTRALFEYMLKNQFNLKYQMVWFVKDPDMIPKEYRASDVEFISFDWYKNGDEKETEKYFYALFHAKYIFTTDAFGFMQNVKPEVKRIQLWHGCGFKTRANPTPCEKRYDYMTVISDCYKEIHVREFGLREEQVLVTGLPRLDWLFQPYSMSVAEIFGWKKTRKVIFWVPTFRTAQADMMHLKESEYRLSSEIGLPLIQNVSQLLHLNSLLQEQDILLVVKLHYLQKKDVICKADMSNIVFLEHEDISCRDIVINRLLAGTDAIISDYSSIAVDYMVLDRPIGFTLDDVEEYQNKRGFNFDDISEWIPGEKLYNFEDMIQFVKMVAEEKDISAARRKALLVVMHKYRDDKNCERVLKAFNIMK